MKIVSKHKDYYDAGSIYGVDESVVLVRTIDNEETPNKIEFNGLKNLPSGGNSLAKKGDVTYIPFIVGFCGITYIGYEITKVIGMKKNYPDEDDIIIKTRFVYGDDIIKELKPIILSTKSWGNEDRLLNLTNGLEWSGKSNLYDYFKVYNTPYFIIKNLSNNYWGKNRTADLYINVSLKSIQFHDVKDMVVAFQDISMFLPTLKQDPISEMTDDQKIHSHGLDETSFRCEAPGNKKEKRRKNKERKRNKN